jgi:hypothetical protein
MPVPEQAAARHAVDHEAEFWILGTEEGQRLLTDVRAVFAPRPADLSRWRKLADAPAVAAAIRLAACRAKATTKFQLADRMWLNPIGLEQSTSELVARHKARRFKGRLIVDLCAGVGGDTLALAESGDVLAVDRDHAMCRRLAWNATVYGVATRVLPCQAKAERVSIPEGAWIHIDPDRRAGRQDRARCLADYVPGLDFLRDTTLSSPGGAIKLSAASDFARHFSDPNFEVELISLDGECKEATTWFGAASTCRRRATRLPENVTWTDRDAPLATTGMAHVREVSTFLYDPDPALIRAGLLDSFAVAHGLGRIAPDVDYLTGDVLLATPFLSAFEVLGIHRLDLKQLRRLVAQRDLGPLEIKVRGLDLTPEMLRNQLRVRGSHPATLILAGGSGPSRAFLARRPGAPPCAMPGASV